jgi:hypothetical protein
VGSSTGIGTYEITIWGRLGENWSDWLDDVTVTTEGDPEGPGRTVLAVSLDQAALRGVLNRIWGLNLTVLSV